MNELLLKPRIYQHVEVSCCTVCVCLFFGNGGILRVWSNETASARRPTYIFFARSSQLLKEAVPIKTHEVDQFLASTFAFL